MKTRLLFSLFCALIAGKIFSQFSVPSCPSSIVYLHNSPIQAYNPALPIGPGNPVSTGIPGGGSGLALMPNINAPSPSPTFYTTIGGNIAWWNGSSWVNTGHSTGNGAAVNLGGGGCYLYNLVGSTGQVYVYNGTGPATLLTTIGTFSGGGPYDICCDANGNWYILKTTTPQQMTMYSPAGAVLATYNMTGMPSTSAGGGFAIIGNQVYVSNSSGFFTGTISGSTISFTNNPGASGTMSAGDYASCPGNSAVSSFTANAVANGTLGCSTTSVGLTTSTNISPVNSYSWSGPGLSGPTNGSAATATAAGVYSCTITKTVCPSTSTVVTVTVTSNGTLITPTITASNSLTCTNPTAQLTVTPGPPGYTYNWSGPGIVGPNNVNVITINQPGTYTASVLNATNTCQGTQTFAVASNTTPPVVTATPVNTTVCAGQTVTLTAGGAVTYTWSTGSNSAAITVTPPATASYTLTGSAANGCTNSAVSSISVVPIPAPSISNSGPLCAGGTLSLTSGGGSTYAWSGPGFASGVQNPTIPNVTTANSGVYTVVASVGSCTASNTTSVTVNPLPAPAITPPNQITCANPTSQLTVSPAPPGYTYNWSGPGIVGPNTNNVIIVNQAGTYNVTVLNSATGCQNSTSVPVTTNTTPPVVNSTPSNTSICYGQTLTLSASGAVTYTWNTGAVTANLNVTPLTNTSYTVTGSAANGCTSTAVSSVSVIALPTPIANNSGPICAGGTLSLSVVATGASSYMWSGPAFASGVQSPVIPNATPANSGLYTVIATVGTCTGSTTTSVTINPLPSPTIQTNSPICEGQALTLNGSGGVIYSWSGPPNFSSGAQSTGIPVSSLNNNGMYTLTVTDANNCQNSTTYFVTVNSLPVVTVSGSTVCANQSVNLSATGGTSYNWSGPNGFTSSAQNPSIPNASTSMSGIYSVTVTNVNNCVNTGNTTAIVNALPTPTAVNNGPLCQGESLGLAAAGGLNYSWTGPNGFTSSVQNPTVSVAYATMSGIYNVTVTDAIGCSGTATTAVQVNPLPVASISSGANTGCTPLCVTFTVQGSSSTLQNNVFDFGTGVSANGLSAAHCFNTSGIYTVSASYTDANNCSNVSTYTVESYPIPVADYNWAPIKPIINIDDVDFTDASYGANIVSWNWYFTDLPNANATSIMQNPSYYYAEPGNYPAVLVVKSDKGCTDTVIKNIVVGEDFNLYVPNAFTPNGDGLNETFQPKGFGIVKYEMMVFDRWGEMLFRTDVFEEGWSGKKQSKNDVNYAICPQGVYAWKIIATDVFGKAHEYTGHVTLIK